VYISLKYKIKIHLTGTAGQDRRYNHDYEDTGTSRVA
jgi:hypothetical protein